MFLFFSCKASKIDKENSVANLHYVYKTKAECDNPGSIKGDTLSYRIYLKFPKLPENISLDNVKGNKCSYYWNQVFFYYSHEEQIALLEELLSFRNDKDLAGLKVCRFGQVDVPNPHTQMYTIQTDALYLFTFLIMGGFAPQYNPYPIIIDSTSGEEINNDQVKIKEVFDLYEIWLEEYKNNGAAKLAPPLRGTKYVWYGNKAYTNSDIHYYDESYVKQINRFPDLWELEQIFFLK